MASERDEMLPYLKAMVLLLLEALPEKEGGPKAELLLQRAGLGIKEISEMLGKSYAATAKTISRGRAT
jgi:DNA-directed RNA polymerase specialized sigma24 family protein